MWLETPRRSLSRAGLDLERRPVCITEIEEGDVKRRLLDSVVFNIVLALAYHLGVLAARIVGVLEDRTRPRR